MGHAAAQEAALGIAQLWTDWSHWVVPPAPQHAQGCIPEMGALCAHGQWTNMFYIRTDNFLI
jgi:hypothetical protein